MQSGRFTTALTLGANAGLYGTLIAVKTIGDKTAFISLLPDSSGMDYCVGVIHDASVDMKTTSFTCKIDAAAVQFNSWIMELQDET